MIELKDCWKKQERAARYFMLPFWQHLRHIHTNDEIIKIARDALFTGTITPLSHPIYREVLNDFDREQEEFNKKIREKISEIRR